MLLTIALQALALLGQSQGTAVTECNYGEWSEPTHVEAIRWGGILQKPELATWGSQEFVIGADMPTLEIPTDHEPFVALRLLDQDLGGPKGDFWFVYPRVAVGQDGVLHMVWGEPDDPPDVSRWGRWTNTALWYARHDGKRWSEPHELVRRHLVDWNLGGRLMEIDSAGRVHVIVDVGDRAGDQYVGERLHLRRANGKWETLRMDDRIMSHPSLLPGRGDTLYLAYVSSGGRGNSGSIFLRRSMDGGMSWSDGDLVHASGGSHATRLAMLGSPDGRLHLVWQQQNLAVGLVGRGLSHTSSADGGMTWSSVEEAAVSDDLLAHVATTDRCGTIHVVFEIAEPQDNGDWRPKLGYARWHNGWSHPVRLFPHMLDSFQAAVAITGQGAPMLYFSGSRETGQDSVQVGGFVSRLEVERN